MKTSFKSIHYAWFIVFAGILVITAILGCGRFALGMLLPSMGKGLGLSYDQMGFLSTSNLVGYLLAVIASGRLVRSFGYRQVITTGVALVGTSLGVLGLVDSYSLVLVAFFITGIGSGVANVPIMGLVSHWFHSSLRGRAAGLMVSGSGIGIILSGLLIPFVNDNLGDVGWRVNWMLLGGISILIAVICGLILRDRPQELGLNVLGKAASVHSSDGVDRRFSLSEKKILSHLGGIYFLFGFTYVIYVTFVVTTLVDEYHFSEATAGQFWIWIGLVGMFSGPLFGSLSDKFGRGRILLLVFFLQSAAYFLLVTQHEGFGLYLSVLLFGISAWSIPSIVAATVGDYMGPTKAVSAFGVVTLVFGAGQILGPAMAGILAENSGSFSSSYLIAAVMMIIAGLASLRLPKH